MALDEGTRRSLVELTEAGVEFIVVGMTAAVVQGAPVVTADLDIVHRRTDENVGRLLEWLLTHRAHHRLDPANRKLPPTKALLAGTGHLNLSTDLCPLDVLCELGPGEGYEELVGDTRLVEIGSADIRVLDLPRLIAVKTRANRPKDRAALPVLIAALDERERKRR